jgi:4-hydroxy-3-polyprenylbenzoate decarboxylase
VLPNERAKEGPHGESQGFYDGVDRAFVIKVKCITHRKNPVIYGLICRPQEDYPKFLFSGVLGEKLKGVDAIKEVYVPEAIGGGLGLMAIVAAKVESPDDVAKVIQAVHNAPGESLRKKPRWLIIVDEDCDVKDWNDVMWRVALAVMPDKDVRIGPRTDPISHEPLAAMHHNVSSSIVIDATFGSKKTIVDGREVGFPRVNRVSKELRSKVEGRWKEYGLD